MAKNTIGIDISDFSIEALSLEKSKGNFKIESYARFRLSPEIVEDGRIINKEKLKDAILKMFQNAQPLAFDNSRKVFLSIPESQTFSRVLSLPKNIKDKDLKKVVFNKAEEIIPEFVEKLTSVVKILSNTEHHRKIFYSSAETEVLKNFVSVFEELNIEVAGITTEAIASFAGVKRDKSKKNTLLLDLGARTTIASIFTDECLCSSININIGGNNITEALSKKLSISYNQAEEKKRSIGLSSGDMGETMLIAQGQLQPLLDELKVFIKYWQKSNERIIEQVILVGGLSQMKGADKYFGDNLNLPTEVGQSFVELKDLPEGFFINKYINVLGLARLAHQNIEINFYKKLLKAPKLKDNQDKNKGKELKNKLKLFNKNILLIILVVILFSSAIAIVLFKDKLLNLYNNENSNNISSIEEVVEEVVEKVVEEPLINLEQKVLISTNKANSTEDFILGEYYEFNFNKIYSPPINIKEEENFVANFSKGIERLENEANVEILNLINKEYKQEDYYIIPRIIAYENLETRPNESEYIIGENLEADIQYKFIMFSEQILKEWLIAKYPYLDNKIENITYSIQNYSADDSGEYFNLSVFINSNL